MLQPAAAPPAKAANGTHDADLLGRIGALQVRLARNSDELAAAQGLRYAVFSAEFGATFDLQCEADGLDRDIHDLYADHLIVIDTNLPGPDVDRIVGTYRFCTEERLPSGTGFYSAQEYALDPLIARHEGKRFMELGRSCVLPQYRSRRTIELLWQGIWAWCCQNDIDVMIGCASFAGVVPQRHALALSFLHHNALSKDEWAVSAQRDRAISMDMMPAEAINTRLALGALPPLIKGYLRLGAAFGEGAVIDPTFRTTDVLVVLPVCAINKRYIAHYGADATRFVA